MKKYILCFFVGIATAAFATEPVRHISFDRDINAILGSQEPLTGQLTAKSNDIKAETLLLPGLSGSAFASGKDAAGNIHSIIYRPSPVMKGSKNAISLWVNPTNWSGSDKNQHVFFSAGNGSQRLLIYKIPYDSRLQVFLGFLDNAQEANIVFTSAKTWVPNQWHHVLVMWDASQLALFLDGKQVAQKPIKTPLTNDFTNFMIGECFGGDPGCTLVDEVRIFDQILNDADAAAEYSRLSEKIAPAAK